MKNKEKNMAKFQTEFFNSILLGKLKPTSRHAQKQPNSSKPREYYKIGFMNNIPYLMDDKSLEHTVLHLDDIECLYCFVNGELKPKNVEQFFKIYRNFL